MQISSPRKDYCNTHASTLKDSSIKPLFHYALCGLVTKIELTIGHPLCKMKWITTTLYYFNMDFDLIYA